MKSSFLFIARSVVFLFVVLAFWGGTFVPTVHADIVFFDHNLSFGTTGDSDVMILQAFLATQGFYQGPITGNYFSLTQNAVGKFQAAQGISSTGYFGPLTRGAVNATLTSDVADIPTSTLVSATVATTSASGVSGGAPTSSVGQVAGASANVSQSFKAQVGSAFQQMFEALHGSHRGGGAPTPSPVQIPTSTLTVSVTVAGGSASLGAFSFIVSDVTTSSVIFSGTPPALSVSFVLPQDDRYTVTEATSSASLNYAIKLGGGCSGMMGSSPMLCGITDTYVPPVVPPVPPTPTSTPPVATSTPTSSEAMMWGAYVGDIDGNPSLISQFDSMVGGNSNIIASFADLSSGDFPSSEKAVVGDQGKTLLLFLEPQYSLSQIASGKYDSILQQYASAAGAYKDPIILAPFDEFNLNENPWGYSVGGNTPAQFVQAWQHIHGFFTGDPNVKFALVYNNVSVPATAANSYAAYYPGSAYVDYVAVDGFNFGATAASAQTFDQIFNPIMPTLEGFGKPILFASLGSLEYPGKAQWITYGLGTYIKKFPNVAGWVYFDYDDTAAQQDWRVDTSASDLAAFRQVIPH